jgi:cobyrinic acid a,c-diamide synthase
VKILGAVRADPRLAIVERHLGLMPGNEAEQAEERIEAIAAKVAEQVDLQAVLDLARAAPASVDAGKPPVVAAQSGLRLAYAQDRAFGFYYQEDLDTLRDAGVELLRLDTLKDKSLPECDGLIIGGGFPEMFAEGLAANADLRGDIRRGVEAGLPVYAECGGLMYLARSLRWDGPKYDMVGVVPGDVVMGSRPVGRGYAVLEETPAALWPAQADQIPAHEFHYSHLENLPSGLNYAYRVLRGHGIADGMDGFVHKHLLASYCHRRGSGPQGWIGPFLEQARAYRSQRKAARKAA